MFPIIGKSYAFCVEPHNYFSPYIWIKIIAYLKIFTLKHKNKPRFKFYWTRTSWYFIKNAQ